jgi:hypothetical protein
VHIVARDPELLERFSRLGFHPGLDPPRAPLGGFHDLTAMLLDAFSRDGPGTLTAGAAQASPMAAAGPVPPGDTP